MYNKQFLELNHLNLHYSLLKNGYKILDTNPRAGSPVLVTYVYDTVRPMCLRPKESSCGVQSTINFLNHEQDGTKCSEVIVDMTGVTTVTELNSIVLNTKGVITSLKKNSLLLDNGTYQSFNNKFSIEEEADLHLVLPRIQEMLVLFETTNDLYALNFLGLSKAPHLFKSS